MPEKKEAGFSPTSLTILLLRTHCIYIHSGPVWSIPEYLQPSRHTHLLPELFHRRLPDPSLYLSQPALMNNYDQFLHYVQLRHQQNHQNPVHSRYIPDDILPPHASLHHDGLFYILHHDGLYGSLPEWFLFYTAVPIYV